MNAFKLNPIAVVLASVSGVVSLQAFAEEKAGAAIETVYVSGEKVSRSLKDTTTSVSVITEEELASLQHLTLTDAVSNVSNVVVLTGALPDIRGVSGNGSATGFNSFTGGAKGRVSMLVDGVAEPFVADLTGDSGLWDIEQVEVFRGPQSTNNGRNSIAGAVYIKTAEPSFDWEGAVRVGYRDMDGYLDTSGVVSGPLVEDTLAFRLSAQRLAGNTYSNGVPYEGNDPDFDLNELETQRVRGKLAWTPSEAVKSILTYATSSEEGNTGRIFYTGDDPWAFNPLFYRDFDTSSETLSLDNDFTFSDDVSADLLIAYMNYDWAFDSYEANPLAEQQVDMDEDNLTIDGKINFGLTNDHYSAYVGLAYFERNQNFNSTGSTVYYGDDTSESSALYGEVDFSLSSQFNLILGGRVEQESQTRDFNMVRGDSLIADVLDRDKTLTLPKAVLQFAPNESITLAISARKGYNAGGGALNFASGEYYYFDDETVDTYEFSIRGAAWDNLLSYSANVFYNEYTDYQALSTSRSIVNMPGVQTQGAEFEAIADLTDALELHAGIGLLATEITDPGPLYPEVKGNELSSAPAFTGNLGLKYWFTPVLNAGLFTQYVGEYYGDFSNTEERKAGDYQLTRVNINYQTESWQVSAFVNNLFDEQGLTTVEPAGGRYPDGYAAIVDPRNMGVSVTYSF